MAEPMLFCPGCNLNYRARKYDPAKTYKCAKCGQPLAKASVAGAVGTDGALDTQGEVEQKEEDPLIGQTVDQYRVEEKLGEGAMGAVYKAEHLTLKRYSALKILPEDMVKKTPDAVERFMREARAAAALSHPNIVAVYGVGESGGRHFIDMEFVEGEDLQGRLKREERLSVDEATRVVRDAAKALGAAHAKDIIHRDVKAGNIMVTKDGVVKVMDFGLAKEVHADAQLTVSGRIMGTPYYMSPEQCDGGELDGRADIYSLGVTYFCLLTGEPPFKGTTCLSIMYRHKTEPPPDPRTLRSDLPAAVCRIIEKALGKDRDARYQTCDELVSDLESVLAGRAPVVAKRGFAKPARALLKAPWFIAAASVLLIAGIVGLTWTLASRGARQQTDRSAGRPLAVVPAAKQTADRSPRAAEVADRPKMAKASASGSDVAPSTPQAEPEPGAEKTSRDPEPSAKAPAPATPKAEEHSPKPEPAKKEPVAPPAASRPQIDAAAKAQAALEQLDRDLAKLMSLRRYDEALSRCDEAGGEADGVRSSEALASRDTKARSSPAVRRDSLRYSEAMAQRVELWRRQMEACQALLVRARARAGQLVGKTHKVEIKAGATGRMRLTGKVTKFEDDTLFLRVGVKDKAIPMSELGPNEIVSLASGTEIPSAGDRAAHARFLLVEGCERDAADALHRAEQQALQDPDAATACAQTKAFFTFWEERQRKAKKERDAQLAIESVKKAYSAGRWAEVSTAVDKLKQDLGDTQAYASAEPLIAVLIAGSQKHQALDEAGREKITRFGPTVQVPGDDGKPEALPAGVVTEAVFSPDSKRLAVAHSFGVDIWDMQTHAIVCRLDGHKSKVTGLDYAPDGKLLATISSDPIVCVWDARKGQLLHRLEGHKQPVRCVRFSPDGRCLALASGDCTVRLWDAAKGRAAAILKGHRDGLRALAFSPNGRRLISVSWAKRARLWDVKNGALLRAIDDWGGDNAVFSPDGKHVAVGCSDGTVRLWDVEKGSEPIVMTGHEKRVHSVDFNPKGKLLASASMGNAIRLWKVPSGRPAGELTGYGSNYGFAGLKFGPKGHWLVAASNATVKFWNLRKGLKQPIAPNAFYWVHWTRFSPDGRWAVAGVEEFGLNAYQMPGAEPVDVVKRHRPRLLSVAVSSDGSRVGFGSRVGPGIWSVEGSQDAPLVIWSRGGEHGGEMPVAFSPDGSRFAYGETSSVRVVDAQTGKQIRAFRGTDQGYVTALAWSVDGSRLASGGEDATVRIWDPAAGKQLHLLKKHSKRVSSVAFSPDGHRLASAGVDNAVYFWDAQTGAQLKHVQMNALVLDFDHGGQRLACANESKVTFLDASSGKSLRSFSIKAVSFRGYLAAGFYMTADGPRFACGDGTGAVRVYDSETGKVVRESHEHRDAVRGVAFSRSTPPVMASASADGSISVWRTGVRAKRLKNPGAKELVWLEKLFSPEQDGPPLVLDLDRLNVAAASTGTVGQQASVDLRPRPDWLGGAQLLWGARKAGDSMKLGIEAPTAGQYVIGARITRSADYGTFELSLSGQTIGEACDCFAKKTRGKGALITQTVSLGPCSLTQGPNEIELEVVGKNPASKGYALGIDAIILWPQP